MLRPAGTLSHRIALTLPNSANAPSVWRDITASPTAKPVTSGPDGDDMARGLATGDERRFGAKLVFSGQHQNVDILDAARLDPDLDFARARWWRIRNFALRQTSGPPNRSHTIAFMPHFSPVDDDKLYQSTGRTANRPGEA